MIFCKVKNNLEKQLDDLSDNSMKEGVGLGIPVNMGI